MHEIFVAVTVRKIVTSTQVCQVNMKTMQKDHGVSVLSLSKGCTVKLQYNSKVNYLIRGTVIHHSIGLRLQGKAEEPENVKMPAKWWTAEGSKKR